MDRQGEAPSFETRVKLAAGMSIPFVFFAILLGKLVGLKAALGLLAVVSVVLVLYVGVPGIFFRRRSSRHAVEESHVEGSSYH